MVTPVNSILRRAQIVEAALKLVAESGFAAASMRKIAHATGYSTGFISHYFVDVKQLQAAMLRAASSRGRERADAITSGNSADLKSVLYAFLPTDASRVRDWKAFAAFIGPALSDPDLAAVRDEEAITTRATLQRAIQAYRVAKKRKRPTRPHQSDAEEADRLLALMIGISLEALLDPRRWTEKRLKQLIDEELEVL